MSDGNRLHGDESLAIKRGDIEPSIMLDGCTLSNTVNRSMSPALQYGGTAGDRSNGSWFISCKRIKYLYKIMPLAIASTLRVNRIKMSISPV